jgi:hypothetical protein
VRLFGLCGTREMILYLINQKHLHYCRSFPWLPTGSVRGHIFNKRSIVIDSGCNRLETVARDLFNRCGWWSHKRIAS